MSLEKQILQSQRDMVLDVAAQLKLYVARYDAGSDADLHLLKLHAEAFVNECVRYEELRAKVNVMRDIPTLSRTPVHPCQEGEHSEAAA